MIYSHITFAQAKQQLANRLYDQNKVFWTDAELGLYLAEALRTWNQLTGYWRNDFVFSSQAGMTWYDLTDPNVMPNTLRPYTLFDSDLYAAMQYHLLEPPIGLNLPQTGASLQFQPADYIAAVQRRRDETLSTTGCTITRRTVGAVAGRIALPDTVIDVRRIAYQPAAGGSSVVWPDDSWSEMSFNRNYTILPAGTPSTYLLSTQPPISFDVDRPPGGSGQYELLTVEAGPALVAGTPQHLAIPDDWLDVVKWGALADMLSRESNSKDALHAQYCEQRYQMGLKLLTVAPALLAMRIDNVAVEIDAVRSADLFQTSWQAQPAGTPNLILHAGLNLLALTPAPSSGASPYGVGLYGVGVYSYALPISLTATVVQNAPIPVAPGDMVQVGRDDLDVVIDYAQHLAAFKMGGAEFTSTIPLFQRFMSHAATYGLKLNELGEYTSIIYGLSSLEKNMNPPMAPQPATEAA